MTEMDLPRANLPGIYGRMPLFLLGARWLMMLAFGFRKDGR